MNILALVAVLAAAEAVPVPSAAPAPGCNPAVAFTGTICAPTTAGKHPVILLLGGSEGGDSMSRVAPAYADQGYVAASIAYYGLPGLPHSLQNVPVETVGSALAAIEKRDDVDAKRIAIFGISKGGELALLAASTYSDIHAVIADVPSPFAWEGIPSGLSSSHESSWTLAGKPLPYVPFTDAIGRAFATAFMTHARLDLRPGYDASMTNTTAIDAAFFHLDKINGPVLFLSAGDDKIWNSDEQSRLGLAYLKKMHHRFADESKSYPLAGHLFVIATPDRPFVDTPFAAGLTLELGGTPKANVEAAAESRQRIYSFLESGLRERR
jgi:dienelactone hydrolase